MAQFTDLPREIVLKLWQYILSPSDTVNFARVSKTTYHMGSKALKEHRRRMNKYSKVHKSHVKQGLPPDALEPLPWECPKNEQDASLLPVALKRNVKKLDFDPGHRNWLLFLEMGDEGPAIALLLVLCPNITELHINQFPPFDEFVADMLWKIAEHPSSGCLEHLTDVKLEDFEDGDIEGPPLIQSLAMISLVHKIHCAAMPDSLFRPEYCSIPYRSSNVEKLSFNACGNIEGLPLILRGLKNLKSFDYGMREIQYSQPFDARAFYDALYESARDSLETLTIDPQKFREDGRNRSHHMGSLKEFTALKVINTEYDLLVNESEGDNEHNIFGRLPKTVQEIKLRVWGGDFFKQIVLFTQSMFMARLTYLEQLNKLTFWTFGAKSIGDDVASVDFPELSRACREVGIDFKVFLEPRQTALVERFYANRPQ